MPAETTLEVRVTNAGADATGAWCSAVTQQTAFDTNVARSRVPAGSSSADLDERAAETRLND